MSTKLTHVRLTSVLEYNSRTGIFMWIADTSKRKRIGTVAGSTFIYTYVKIDKTLYLAHRLAFFFVKKRWPKNEIDHRNRNPADNRWVNLRECSSSQNKMNTAALGVAWDKNRRKWVARIGLQKRTINLGRFSTFEHARAARLAAQKIYFGEFGRSQ